MVKYSVLMTHTSYYTVQLNYEPSITSTKAEWFRNISSSREYMYPVPENVLQLKFNFQPCKGHITGILRLLKL